MERLCLNLRTAREIHDILKFLKRDMYVHKASEKLEGLKKLKGELKVKEY